MGDVRLLHNTLEACLGHGNAPVNIFEVGDGESPEDVPGGGDLAPIAERLYNDLSTVLSLWEDMEPGM